MPVPISKKLMNELKLDPKTYASCSMPDKDRNVGCEVYAQCRLAEKQSGEGPCFKGCTLIKRDIKGKPYMVNHIPGRAKELEINEGLLKVVANEGEEIMLRGSESYLDNTPGKVAEWKWKDFANNVKVPPYKDEETDDLLNRALASDAYEKMSVDRIQEREQEMIREAVAPQASVSGRVSKSTR